MPYIYTETRNENGRITKREVYDRTWPRDVREILGGRFIHKWPAGVTRQEADDDPTALIEYRRRIEDARAGRTGQPSYWRLLAPVLFPGRDFTLPDLKTQIAHRKLADHIDYLHVEATTRRGKPSVETVETVETNDRTDPETAIDLWKGERIAEGKPPKDKAINSKRAKMRDLFCWLRTHHGFIGDDMAAVSPGLLNLYKQHLIQLSQEQGKPTLTHEHLHEIKFLYMVADRNPGLHGARFPNGNPAEKLHIPGKPEHTPTKQLEDHEARAILLDTRRFTDPLVRWGHWLAFHGCITSEIIAARKSEFKLIDGDWVFDMTERRPGDMKTGYRPRGLPLYRALIDEGFVDWVQSLPEGRIFHIDAPNGRAATRASRVLIQHIRSLGIQDVQDHDGRVSGHKNFKSWRKGFCSQLEDLTTPDRARFLAGHAAADVHAKHYLEHELKKLVTAIEGLRNPIG